MLSMIIALLLLALLVGVIMILSITPNNRNSACTGNCRQGRDCDCMENKNEKSN